MFEKWQAEVYNGTGYVFRKGALLDTWTEKFAVYGGKVVAEKLAALLNGEVK